MPTNASHDGRVRLRSTALDWRIVGGEVVILDGSESRYLSVNETGATLWPLLADGATRAALIAALLGEFDVTEAQADTDVDAFIGSLRDLGLLEGSEGDGPDAGR